MRKVLLSAHSAACLLFAISLQAQWVSIGSGISTVPRSIYGLSSPNPSVVWGITIHPQFTAAAREFTRSTNGGLSWTSGVIDPTGGQNFTALNIFALDANTAWVAMTDNGTQRLGRIYKTTNGGLSWSEQQGSFRNINNMAVAIHFFDANNGIAYGSPATGEAIADSLRIWRTTNGGDTWTRIAPAQLPTPLAGEGVWIYYGNGSYDVVGDTIWFGTRRGRIWRSVNRGLNWQAFNTGANVPIYSVAFTDARSGLAVSDEKGFRTFDGGVTWNEITLPRSFAYYQIENVPGAKGVYVLLYEGSNMFYSDFRMAYTLNDGDTWITLSPRPIECVKFLSPTQGWGGGRITSASSGGIYRWTGNFNALTATEEPFVLRKSFQSSPNPFADYTVIEFEVETPAPIEYRISSLTGKLLEFGRVERLAIGKNQVMIAPKVPAGVYLLTLRQEDRTHTIRLVKQ